MRLGLIARADDRGLGYQTRRFYEALRPAVTVAVRNLAQPQDVWPVHEEWYPDAVWSDWRGLRQPLADEAIEALLSCDVIYTAETYYDERLPAWCARKGKRLVLHANPEFWRPGRHDVVWLPTTWRSESVPHHAIVEVPCPDPVDLSGPDLFVHVGGHRASGDRDGAMAAWWASHNSTRRWRLCTQDGLPGRVDRIDRVEVLYRAEDWRDLYRDGAVLVAPRAYGGLSVPVLEAMSCGLAVAMPDIPPNTDWPTAALPWRKGPQVSSPGGNLETAFTDPRALAVWSNGYDPSEGQAAAKRWATEHCWSAQADGYRARFEALR